MSTLAFEGKTVPEQEKITISKSGKFEYRISEIGVDLTCQIEIKNSHIIAECVVPNFRPEWLAWCWSYVNDFTRSQVDLVAFARSTAFEVVFEYVIFPDKSRHPLSFHSPFLIGLSHAVTDETFDRVRMIVGGEPNLFLALSELSVAMRYPNQRTHACQRAIERLKNLIAKDLQGTEAWDKFRATLDLDREFIQLISDASKDARHGRLGYTDSNTNMELLKRSWTVMNRYISYRLLQDRSAE